MLMCDGCGIDKKDARRRAEGYDFAADAAFEGLDEVEGILYGPSVRL